MTAALAFDGLNQDMTTIAGGQHPRQAQHDFDAIVEQIDLLDTMQEKLASGIGTAGDQNAARLVRKVERMDLEYSGCKTADGRIWFPNNRGVVTIDPANIPINPLPPPIATLPERLGVG